MIPKIIHYCWVGPNPIPEKELACIKSWKKYLPDHKLMFWNEETFDINANVFARQAYEGKHYAFVSDYIRTKVLYEYGGIYLDTDVELFTGFDKVLANNNCFLGFETRAKLGTAVMGFTPKHPVLEKFMDFYLTNDFKDTKGNVNTIANVTILTDILSKLGLTTDGSAQQITDIEVYPREFFYPKKISDDEFRFTEQTIAVHRCSNSWMTDRERKRGKNKFWIEVMRPMLRSFREFGQTIIGEERIQKIEIKIRNILK
jgi:mannosyltransferase OCH1-like enzyme